MARINVTPRSGRGRPLAISLREMGGLGLFDQKSVIAIFGCGRGHWRAGKKKKWRWLA
jgi:hypothetical protein